MDLKGHYQYLEYSNFRTEVQLKRLKLIVSLTEKLSKKSGRFLKILDVGCGIGNISIPLASLGHEVLGIDIDKPTIIKARELNSFKNAQFKVLTVDDIPRTRKFDIIICCEILEHLNNPNSFLASILLHLLNSGYLVISIPNGYGPYEITEFIKHCWVKIFRGTRLGNIGDRIFYQYVIPNQKKVTVSRDIESPHVDHYSLRRFYKLISENGLKITLMRNTNFISGIFPLYMIPSKMFSKKIKFEFYDCILSERIPSCMASGWYFELIKIKK